MEPREKALEKWRIVVAFITFLFADVLTEYFPSSLNNIYYADSFYEVVQSFFSTGGNPSSRLECRTWQELFLMKACYVGGFHQELPLWDLAPFNVLFLLRGIGVLLFECLYLFFPPRAFIVMGE